MAANTQRSAVWRFFEKNEKGDQVKCTLCSVHLVFKNSTGSMNNHLRWRHPSRWSETGTAGDGAYVGASSSGARQTTMRQFAAKKCEKGRSESITNLIGEMVALDMQPMSVVEDEGFKKLISFLEPDYTMPSRKTVTSRVLKLYLDCSAKIKHLLDQTMYVALTTDCWTSLTTTSYMTVTCHYIDEEWQMQAHVLATQNMEERHTAENLQIELETVVAEWNVSGRVSACVHDNAANIVKANQACDWESVCCFAHTLQLAINDGFKAVQILERMIGACSKLVAHFHHSTTATQALAVKQKQMSVKEHALIQCCKTRWNSIYGMFERLTEQRWAVCAVLSDRSVTKPADARNLELKDEYWRLMEEMDPVLKALAMATTAACGEEAVSLSVVYPMVCGLMNEHLQPSGGSDKVATFVNTVRESLVKRFLPWDTITASKPAVVAAALDPRHKKLRFMSPDMQAAAKTHMEAIFEVEKDKERASRGEQLDEESGDDVTAPKRQKKSSAMAFLLGAPYEEEENPELDRYLSLPACHLDTDPLAWWKTNQQQYPVMARLAKRFLSIPATSVPSERVFSAAGLLVSKQRSRLLPDNVNMLIFLNKNLPRPCNEKEKRTR